MFESESDKHRLILSQTIIHKFISQNNNQQHITDSNIINYCPYICSLLTSIFWFCILYILVLYSIFWFSIFSVSLNMWPLSPQLISISTILLSSLFYILCPVHYLLFTIQFLTPVFWFCIFYILVLYLLCVIKYVSSWSSTYLYIRNSLIFSLLCSMSYSLSSIHVSIYLQFNHLSVLISTCFSLQCLVCFAHISRYSIVSAPIYCFQIHYNSSHKYTVVNTIKAHQ